MGDTVVTGGTGFLGRALLRALVAEGRRPVALVRRSEALHEVRSVYGDAVRGVLTDLDDTPSIVESLRPYSPRSVFHLAGGRAISGRHDLSANIANNLTPTIALIEALDASRLEAFVMASTGEVYGPQPGPFHEGLALLPASAYAASKASAEAASMSSHRTMGLPTIVTRMSVVYGPGPWANATGKSVTGMLLPQLMAAALAKKPFPMSPGDQTRDFLYVDDAADALIALSKAPSARGQIVNVGSGQSVAVGEVVDQLLELLGRPIALELGAKPHRPNDILEYSLDIKNLVKLTGFSPQVSLSEGLFRLARGG